MLVDQFMNLVLDYDAHCEKEEQEVQRRKEKEEMDMYNMIQGRLNNKVSNIMRSSDSLKLIARGIKPINQGNHGSLGQKISPPRSGLKDSSFYSGYNP